MPDGKVLILEDDQSLASTYDEIIASLTGKERVVVHSVAELRERLDDALGCAPAILDVDLGEGLPSGLDAYDLLRRNVFAGRVYFLTGHALSHPLVARAAAMGGATVLSKPVEFERLLEIVTGERHGPG